MLIKTCKSGLSNINLENLPKEQISISEELISSPMPVLKKQFYPPETKI
jgi:hypothetical protein